MTLITVAIVLGAVAFVLWLLYTVVWRGVRRGLREYHRHDASELLAPRPGVHRVATGITVPDYPPREWV